MSQSDQINELAAALAKAQGAMQNAVMNRTNPHFKSKYADLSSVLDAIRAPLSSAGLSVVQTLHPSERGMMLRTTLMHTSGQFIDTEYPLPATQKPHEMGSALTYARRYSLAALICNSSDEDDDGNEAMKHRPNGNAPVSATPPPISEDDLKVLRSAIDAAGIDVDLLCEHFHVKSLEDIDSGLLPQVLQALARRKNRSEAS